MPDAPQTTRGRRGRAFWVLWSFDALVAAVVVFFFLWGLADGTVSSFNIMLWLGMLAFVGVVVAGSLALQNAGRTTAAFSLLFVLAIPGFGFALFLAAVLILQPRWN
jgi:hypothetical protein